MNSVELKTAKYYLKRVFYNIQGEGYRKVDYNVTMGGGRPKKLILA